MRQKYQKHAILIMLATATLLIAATFTLGYCLRPCLPAQEEIGRQEPQESIAAQDKNMLACRFFDAQQFARHMADATAAASQMQLETGFSAVILPHHLTAGSYIAAAMQRIAECAPETVVFLAPNHSAEGGSFVYSLQDWNTPFGRLCCNTGLSEYLMRDELIGGRLNDAKMQEDHAISALIPYLAAALPKTQTVSILIAGGTDMGKINRLADLLSQTEEDIMLICSVDFSHYLQSAEAAVCDTKSIEAITKANFPLIAEMDNDYFDSPPCVTAFLRFCQARDLHQELCWHGSSPALSGIPETQYVEGGITTYQIWIGK